MITFGDSDLEYSNLIIKNPIFDFDTDNSPLRYGLYETPFTFNILENGLIYKVYKKLLFNEYGLNVYRKRTNYDYGSYGL